MILKLNIKLNYGYFFVLPFFLVVLLFQVYPIVDTVMTSFTDDNLSHPDTPPQFVGLENYAREVSAPLVAKALFNTLEAAIIDGASTNQVFRHISLPFIRPILGFLIILSLILNLCQFDIPFALYPSPSGGGASRAEALGPPGGVDQNGITLGTYAYHRAFVWDSDLGSASAVVVLMFGLIAMLSALYFLVIKHGQDDFSVLR